MNYDELVRNLRENPVCDVDGGLLDEAADAIESLQRDANRYRWLRDSSNQGYEIILQGEALDKHIDEAMRESHS